MNDRKLILGYPRSGNNWIKYCINNITGSGVEYSHGNHERFWKTNAISKDFKLIFIIRNYKESLTRHRYNNKDCLNRKPHDNEKRMMDDLMGITPLDRGFVDQLDYIAILKFYEEYNEKRKIKIHFEDMIMNPEKEIRNLMDLLEYKNEGKINDFVKNIERHKIESIRLYDTKIQKTVTRGKVDQLIHHSRKLRKEFRLQMDNHLETNFSELFKKHLLRYKEN